MYPTLYPPPPIRQQYTKQKILFFFFSIIIIHHIRKLLNAAHKTVRDPSYCNARDNMLRQTAAAAAAGSHERQK